VKGVSVIVCCYNSAERLPKTIEHLAKQVVPETIPWEIVLVDNASTDNTATVAREEWVKYSINYVHLRVVFQPKPGLTYARETGIIEAKYDVLIFCDDDNWLDRNYIANTSVIMSNNKRIGALGGRAEAVADSPLPEWFDRYKYSYASYAQAEEDGELRDKHTALFGAGMVLRKLVWNELRLRGYSPILSDRLGSMLSSGGDTELCFAIRLLGYKLWYSDTLVFKHFMPAQRLTINYLIQLNKSLAYSSARLSIHRYVLENQKINKWILSKDFIYKLIFLIRSLYRSLIFDSNRIDKRLDLDFSFYSLRGIASLLWIVSSTYNQLLNLRNGHV
jgi:glycosyltransferase involved in cell wall biosynthesis